MLHLVAAQFDKPALHDALNQERLARGLSWPSISAETGVSLGTLWRLKAGGQLDVDSALRLVDWLGESVERFTHWGPLRVVDHEPHAWFLFESGSKLLLDVNCNHSAFGYSVLIELSREEIQSFSRRGRAYLNELAEMVQDSGPGRGHQLRDIHARYLTASLDAIESWRKANAGSSNDQT